MSANSPIRAVPQQVAEPSYFIQRFLRSVQPYYYHHARYGPEYFERSREAGDQLLKEDWELASQFSPESTTSSALPPCHQVDPIVAPSLPPSSSLLGSQAAARQHSTSPGLSPADTSTGGRGKHSRPRTGNALRTAPYARRPKEATPAAAAAYYTHQHQQHPSSESADGLGELREHRMHAGAGQERRIVSADDNVHIALLKQQYNERRRRSSEEQEQQQVQLAPVTVPESNGKRNRATRPPDLEVGHKDTKPRSIQAEAGRLTLHPVTAPHADVHHPRGIFLRGVASHPVTVSQQHTPLSDADARAGGSNGFDQLRFLGINEEPRLQHLHLQQQQYQQQPYQSSTLAASDKPQPQLSMRTTPPADYQLPPLHTLHADALAPRYREAAADQTHSLRADYTTPPPYDTEAYAGFPPYGEGSGRGETLPSILTVTPEKSNIWGSALPTAARQPHVSQLQRQHQQYQQLNAQQAHPQQYYHHQSPAHAAHHDHYSSYLNPHWHTPAYYAEPTPQHQHQHRQHQPTREACADHRAVSADPRRYDGNDYRSTWDRPYSAPPPLGRETSHLMNAKRGAEPPAAATRPRPTQWPSAPELQQQGSQGSPPRDSRRQWTPVHARADSSQQQQQQQPMVVGPDALNPVVLGGADWPEPITVPGSTPTWDPSPTSSHFQVPYTPQAYPTPLFPTPTATSLMPTMIDKQAPPVDMYHTTATPFY